MMNFLFLLLFSATANAGVTNGQPVNAAVTNAAFLDKNTDTSTVHLIGLLNSDVATGSSISSAQREFNAQASFLGSIVNQSKTYLPTWATNNLGTSTDSIFLRTEAIDAAFDGTTGHAHTGSAGQGPVLDIASATSGTLQIPRGGTGGTTAQQAFDNLSPLTTLGDLLYFSTLNTRLPGNTTTTLQVLSQTGNGTISAAPAWLNAVSTNTASTVVARDGSGNFAGAAITGDSFRSSSANIATAGQARFANTDTIDFRNAGNSSNLYFGPGSSDAVPTWTGIDLVNLSTTQTLTNKSMSGSTNTFTNIPDGALSSSYLYADGTRALTGNWAAGTFSITANSVVVGGAANTITGVGSLTSSTANPATAGTIRLANGNLIEWRNNANSANKNLTLDSSDIFQFTSPINSTGNITGANLSGTNTGDVTLSAFGSTPNANGASLSGQALTLQPADGTNPGGVSTTTQTFAGAKTFSGAGSFTSAGTGLAVTNNATVGGTLGVTGDSTFTNRLSGGQFYPTSNVDGTTSTTGSMYYSGANGLSLVAATASSTNDFALLTGNGVGSQIMTVPHGTLNVALGGSLSTADNISVTKANTPRVTVTASTSTNSVFGLRLVNGGGTSTFGLEDSVGGALVTGGTAYALSMQAGSGRVIELAYGNGAGVALRIGTTNATSILGTLNVSGNTTLAAIIENALLISPTAPTISSGFGTSPSIASNNGTAAFTVNVGTGGVATSGVIGLTTASTGWNCFCNDITTTSATVFMCKQTASTTTTATVGNFTTAGIAGAWTASDILRVSCFAY